MIIFQYEQIHNLNKKEFVIYNYVTTHLKEASDMNIRELSCVTGVSTTTVLRFCKKVGCDGYAQFRYRLRKMLEERTGSGRRLLNPVPAIQYLQQAIVDEPLEQKLTAAAKLCAEAELVVFIGSGASGSIAEYGAHFLAGVGIRTAIVKDVFFPLPAKSMERTVLMVLSVSGENRYMIDQMNGYKKKQAKVISMTNTDQTTISRVSDINFTYFMPVSNLLTKSGEEIGLTTQIPVVHLLEALTEKIYNCFF